MEHWRRLSDYPFRQGVAAMNTKLPILALGLLTLSVGATSATAMPAAPLTQDQAATAVPAQYYDDDYVPRRRPRVTVYPNRPYFDDYSNFYPAVRGFGDRNPVPRGNMRGCTVDLGYGRYETCDK
jgi:hypothetical protein